MAVETLATPTLASIRLRLDLFEVVIVEEARVVLVAGVAHVWGAREADADGGVGVRGLVRRASRYQMSSHAFKYRHRCDNRNSEQNTYVHLTIECLELSITG